MTKNQTTKKEIDFIKRLKTAKKLCGYIEGTKQRKKENTNFDIQIILLFAEKQLERLKNA